MKLHLGCGNDLREGYVNCDISKEVNPDKIVNLEKTPLPFKDNSVSEVVANHVFEHIRNFTELVHDLHRVCKKNAVIKIKVPFYSSWGQWNDPTHVRAFSPFTFGYFNKGNYSHEVNAKGNMFDIRKTKINFGVGSSSKLNWLFNPFLNMDHRVYCRFFAWIFPAAEIEFELVVLK
jgi:hypothetical protein